MNEKNFIEKIIEEDLRKGFPKEKLHFRFPPEPNGYLHIGHAKAICLNFGLAEKYRVPVNLRFDNTNPTKEKNSYVEEIKKDIQWLGFKWDKECYASDYFEDLYKWSKSLIKFGKAYVEEQTKDLINYNRKTPFEVGISSPFSNRSIEENLNLFHSMKYGEFEEGSYVLRAKIDMSSSNMNLRDPIMYRILKHHHNKWCIYPTYDWAHGQSDYIEKISHSLCSLEFENHRPLYDWYLDQIPKKEDQIRPKQIEFSRLNLSYTILSKRKLHRIVEEGVVRGWDDPRMPTLRGLRRRGYTAKSIRDFCNRIGIAKRDNLIDLSLLEFFIREHLNVISPRTMVVIDPIELVIDNYPDSYVEWFYGPELGKIPFSKFLYIERDDFMENASKKFFRLTLDQEVRLKNAYIIKAVKAVKDINGKIVRVHCLYDPNSKGIKKNRNIKGTLHWVSIKHSFEIEVRLYNNLFLEENPEVNKVRDFMDFLNPNSLQIVPGYAEPALRLAKEGDQFQFQRLGYFCVDPDSSKGKLVFNKTVCLKNKVF